MEKVKIDHFFEMPGWEGEALALKQVSSQVCADPHPGGAQVHDRWGTLKSAGWLDSVSREEASVWHSCPDAQPLWPELPLSV